MAPTMGLSLAFSILTLTVAVAISRPQIGAFRLNHVHAATFGALAALLTGVVQWHQAIDAIQNLAFPIITIASLMAITLIAEQAGIMRFLAFRMTESARGSPDALFTRIFILGAGLGTVFTNDAAILILTPLVFAMVQAVGDPNWTEKNRMPFYFCVLYVGNLVGALVISNPINLVVTTFFDISFLEYAAWMIPPAVVSAFISYAGLRSFFRNSFPKTQNALPASFSTLLTPNLAWPCFLILGLTVLGFFLEQITHIPVWLVALSGAVSLMLLSKANGLPLSPVLRGIGWDVLVFVTGIFIVVIGLRNQGFAHSLSNTIQWLGGESLTGLSLATGFVSGLCSAVFNNHPTAGLMVWVVEELADSAIETKILVFSALIGGDLGPKMLPIGSLAALMWFRMLHARGVEVSYWLYVKIGVPVTLAAIGVALAVLQLELWIVTALGP